MVKFLWDYDSVLADTAQARIDSINEKFGTHYKMSEVTTWYNHENNYMLPEHDAWGWGEECFLSSVWQSQIPVVAHAIEGVHRLIELGHTGMIVSDRPPVLFEVTRDWLDNHGLDEVRLLFTRHKHSKSGEHGGLTKAQAAAKYRLTHCVDDGPHHAERLSQLRVVEKFYILDAPYNRRIKHNDKIIRCSSWLDVIHHAQELPSQDELSFWRSVDRKDKDDCWLWQKGTTKDGYGMLNFRGRTELAHRVAYFLGNEETIMPFVVIRHTCDNPPCCNPNHLLAGTQNDNVQDMVIKERNRQGEQHQFAKLIEQDILVIFALKEKGYSHQTIADNFGVDKSIITRILNGHAWQKTVKRLGVA